MNLENSEQEVDDFYLQSVLLAKIVERVLKQKANVYITKKPDFEKKPVILFNKKMRVSSLGVFDEKTYISSINFYRNQAALKEGQVLGAFVLFFPETYVIDLFKKFEYPVDDEDDSAGIKDACGSLCNLIAGSFKTGLLELDYSDIVMSAFSSFVNDSVEGVACSQENQNVYEVSFQIKKEKKLVAWLNMGRIPKVWEITK